MTTTRNRGCESHRAHLVLYRKPYCRIVGGVNGTSLRIQKVHELTPAKHTTLGWKVTDIRAQVDALVRNGVRFERYEGLSQDAAGIWASPSGALVAWFQDPDGNVISLTQ